MPGTGRCTKAPELPKVAKIFTGFSMEPTSTQRIIAERTPYGGLYVKQGSHSIYVPATEVAQFQRAVASMREVQ